MPAERWITPLGMADRAAAQAVNRSDLWYPYGHLKQSRLRYWFTPPLTVINRNFERTKMKPEKLSEFGTTFDITYLL